MSGNERKYTGMAKLFAIEEKQQKERAAEKAAERTSQVSPASTPVISTPVETTATIFSSSPLLQNVVAVETTGAVETTPAQIKKGYQRIPNEIIDNILPTMRPAEQAVYLRLYRLSHGFNQRTCLISLPKLALMCHLSVSQTRFAVRNVETRGYIKQLKIEQGAKDRGIEFEVWTPVETTPVKNSTVVSTPVETTPNIYKDLKDKNKRAVMCPDCKNTNWYYPEGVAKGVKKCPHARLKNS